MKVIRRSKTFSNIDILTDVGAGIHYADKDYNLLDPNDLLKKSCLTAEQIYRYLENRHNNPFCEAGYCWNIDGLKIYEKPKELSEFSTTLQRMKGKQSRYTSHLLQRPPQSWCYVEELEGEDVKD